MDDDFNTSVALSHLFELVRAINQARDTGTGTEALETAQSTLQELSGILGLRLATVRTSQREAAPFVDLLVELRTRLRREKQWALADEIRNRLMELGVVVEDTKEGSTWRVTRG
jgi:cysteinyl-tRNA synthetase